jgi:hypothetical protein
MSLQCLSKHLKGVLRRSIIEPGDVYIRKIALCHAESRSNTIIIIYRVDLPTLYYRKYCFDIQKHVYSDIDINYLLKNFRKIS